MAKTVSDSDIVREIASRCYGRDALEILLLIETMEVQNTDPVNENLSDAGAANALIQSPAANTRYTEPCRS